MKKMNKMLSVIMAAAMAVSMTACGSDAASDNSTAANDNTTTATEAGAASSSDQIGGAGFQRLALHLRHGSRVIGHVAGIVFCKHARTATPFGKISVTDDFAEHLEQFAHALELCKVLGCDRMRMFSFYYPKDEDPEKYQDVVFERIEKMLDLAEKAGVTLCHENEKGIYGDVASRCLKLIEHFGGRLKCIFDPANFIQCGEKPIENFALLTHMVNT